MTWNSAFHWKDFKCCQMIYTSFPSYFVYFENLCSCSIWWKVLTGFSTKIEILSRNPTSAEVEYFRRNQWQPEIRLRSQASAEANDTKISWASKFLENSKTVKFPKCEPFWEEKKGTEVEKISYTKGAFHSVETSGSFKTGAIGAKTSLRRFR